MKRIFSDLIVMILLFSIFPFSVGAEENKHIEKRINGVNCYRNEGYLVVYNVSLSKTETNEWGYEAVVNSENRVVSVGGNNSTVPENGFVLSGHNSNDKSAAQSAAFIKDNVKVGDYIYYDATSLMIIISSVKTVPDFAYSVTYNKYNEYRDTNDMVLYKKTGSTGTNLWGYEIAVDSNGNVTSIGGNNSEIPSGGYVLSAHGSSISQLDGHILVGMSAVLNTSAKTVTFRTTSKTKYLKCLSDISSITESIESAKKNCSVIDYKTAESDVITLKDKLEKAYKQYTDDGCTEKAKNVFYNICDEIESECQSVTASCTESVPVEYRGVWIRPTQKTPEEVAEYVQKLYDAGINMLCIETLYNGYMIMPMPSDSLFTQNPLWDGFDMLEAFITECHKRQMELHLWLPVYYVGHTGSNGYTVYDKKPEWRIENADGETASDSSFEFLNPCNEEVNEFLLDTYRYILETYDVDGLQLDYIRFQSSEWGFNKEIKDGFKNATGYTVTGYAPNAVWWNCFCQYRADFVTSFVKSVHDMIKSDFSDVILSADVFSDIDSAVTAVCQDTKNWLDNGLIDMAFPMAYGKGVPETTVPMFDSFDNTPIVCGLGSYVENVNALVYALQVQYCRNYGTLGASGFEASAYLNRDANLCKNGVYSVRAATPSWSKTESVKLYAEYIKRRITESAYYLGYIDDRLAKSLCEDIDEFAESFVGNEKTDASALLTAFRGVENTYAKNALLRDLNYLNMIITLPNTGRTELLGDADCDGKLTVNDYIAIRLHILGIENLSNNGKSNSDMDGNGIINSTDYIALRLKLLGM